MCGIAGFLLFRSEADDSELERRLMAMAAMLAHRGPDGHGTWTDGVAGLAHTRLAVIDLSPAGHQPMASEDGRFLLVFNGEIYNFRDLRRQLADKGFRFRGHSDTEVLLNGYCAWGEEVFPRLRGMFALALWDRAERRLVLARDMVGKKPLYYGRSGGALLFASEIKAVLTWPDVRREPNLEAIHHYLSLQYVPVPWSAFTGFSRLPAGHLLTIGPDGRECLTRYARLPPPGRARPRQEDELLADLTRLLDQAVRRRLVSDVPVGAFLSGGVDSSTIVAIMARQSTAPIRTFTIGFEENGYDERAFARSVAERWGTDHQELVVRPDVTALVPALAWHYGEPYADSSALPTYCLAELTRRSVTVALTGDGGDELLLGYGRYADCRPSGWLDRLPTAGRRLLAAAGPWLSPRLAAAVRLDSRRYEPNICYFYDRGKSEGYGPQLRPLLSRSSLDLLEPYFAEAPDMVSGAAWADIHTYLPDDLLVKVDIATMAHGMEARSPLLDQDLMEWAAGVPAAAKLQGGTLKYLLKTVMAPYLSTTVLHRPKMGFGVPIDRWLRGPLRPLAEEMILSQRAIARGLFRPAYTRFLLERHLSGHANLANCLWALIMLEQWFRSWIDGPLPTIRPGHRIESMQSRGMVG